MAEKTNRPQLPAKPTTAFPQAMDAEQFDRFVELSAANAQRTTREVIAAGKKRQAELARGSGLGRRSGVVT